MKILMFVHSLRRGGAERVLLEVASGLREKGHDVEVVAWLDVDEYRDERYCEVPRHFLMRQEKYRWPWAVPNAAKGLQQVVKRFCPDVIEIHTPTVAWVVAWANLNIPCVHVIHGYGAITREGSMRDSAVRFVHRMVQHRLKANFITVSPAMAGVAATYFGTGSSLFEAVPNGVDLSKFRPHRNPPDNSTPTIMMLGTLSLNKGHACGLHALGTMLEYRPSVRLRIVGEGAAREALGNLVKALGLEGHVEFLGRREDVSELMATAHTLWQLSESEGLPMVVLEAMAAGLPVVGFDVRGTRDVVVDGETGYLVPYGDVQAVARKTAEILNDQETFQRLTHQGQLRVQKHFSLAGMVEGHERMLRIAADGTGIGEI